MSSEGDQRTRTLVIAHVSRGKVLSAHPPATIPRNLKLKAVTAPEATVDKTELDTILEDIRKSIDTNTQWYTDDSVKLVSKDRDEHFRSMVETSLKDYPNLSAKFDIKVVAQGKDENTLREQQEWLKG